MPMQRPKKKRSGRAQRADPRGQDGDKEPTTLAAMLSRGGQRSGRQRQRVLPLESPAQSTRATPSSKTGKAPPSTTTTGTAARKAATSGNEEENSSAHNVNPDAKEDVYFVY